MEMNYRLLSSSIDANVMIGFIHYEHFNEVK